MHQNIKRFQLEGQFADEARMPHVRLHYENIVIEQMRDVGYIPVLDLGSGWSTSMREDETFDFLLTIHGIYVGRKRAWDIEGISGEKLIPRTPPTKSNESSKNAE